MMSDRNKLDKCIRDLNKILEAERSLQELEVFKTSNNNVNNFIDYILSNKIIESLEDVFYVIRQRPEISNEMAECIRKNEKIGTKLLNVNTYSSSSSSESKNYAYSGKCYDSIRDVPGYGTEWNERCIPDGVYIKGSYGPSRC